MKNFIILAIVIAFAGAQQVLLSGAGDSTFYYDINGGGTCGPVNGIYSFPEDYGYPMCDWTSPNPKELIQYGTNNIVAMPSNILRPSLSTYCGKKVIVTIDGQVRNDLNLVIWDGCEACNDNDGLDFSSTIFGTLFGANRCAEGRIKGEMSWQIVDEQIIPFSS